ncbi:hypothetical protein [Rhizobium sp. 2MFCol3.1]|uniref:sacsin N-terminal ATP-binding-like domain-containing protein n=1 Tax=Rhizobium sp. 2MFCol3.1 TaxID=1246459 RepID=UPI00037EE540|nr:hypothetical protein [Rhizobium sp. 2MFCol3.1]
MLNIVSETADHGAANGTSASQLREKLDKQIRNAVDITRDELGNYKSLRNLSEVIGGEYGDRVIFELFQNAHDAHRQGNNGEIYLKLVIRGDDDADLYVANKGQGFDWENVEAIRNIAVSSKSVGEGIGNKGLGFRSIEILTDDVRIYSQELARPAETFDGFCFRFAGADEVRQLALAVSNDESIASDVAATLPRYLASVPIAGQSADICYFAQRGFATVVHAPLKTAAAVKVAREQLAKLQTADAPLLLFLERLERVVIEIEVGEDIRRMEMSRSVEQRQIQSESPNSYAVISIEPSGRRYVIATRLVDHDDLRDAVSRSVPAEPQLRRWLNWRGDAKVSVAVGLGEGVEVGRTYNFLPMSEDVASPIRGHIDAPFYATIDRRRVNLALPLNAFLMDVLARTAAQAALDVKQCAEELGRATVFDFAAWDPRDKDRLSGAWKTMALDWSDVEVVPSANKVSWSSIKSAWIWRDTDYRQFRVSKLVKAGVANIADPNLGTGRLGRLEHLIASTNVPAVPAGQHLAGWTELLAKKLLQDNVAPKTWSSFYSDVSKAFGTIDGLSSLKARHFLKGRTGELHKPAAESHEDPVFVRTEGPSKREKNRAPLPPAHLAKQFAILQEDVGLKPDVLDRFTKAGIVRRYDAVEILKGVGVLLTKNPTQARLSAAIRWAFEVWKAEPTRVHKVLPTVGLLVEARSGWKAPSEVYFSEEWTQLGKKTERYLAEAMAFSNDCKVAAGQLLVKDPSWVLNLSKARLEWTTFLRALGVRDGLPLVGDALPSRRTGWMWRDFLREKNAKLGRGDVWIAANDHIQISNHNTDYSSKGMLWRIPGQIEHQSLPSELRERLAELLLWKLRDSEASWQFFKIGRYERDSVNQNERSCVSPAGAFIRGAEWMPAEGEDEMYAALSKLWYTSDRRQRVPRFMPRPIERFAAVLDENDALAKRLLAPEFGLLDWAAPSLAPRKLIGLAAELPGLEPRERVNFRKANQRALAQMIEERISFDRETPTIASQDSMFAVVLGDRANPPPLYIASDTQTPEARALTAAGLPILDVGDEQLIDAVVEALSATGLFNVQRADGGQVLVLVDGQPFSPTLDDPLLLSDGLEWLSEAVAFANELLGKELERQISSAAVERRLRRVRLRRCGHISLSVDGKAADDALTFYAFDDQDIPTLVIASSDPIDWPMLGDAAPYLSTLLDRRMRSLETLLLRLAAQRGATSDPRRRPSDEALARALGCKLDFLREHTDALQTDQQFLSVRLLPTLTCFIGIDAAREFGRQIGDRLTRGGVIESLELHAESLPSTPTSFFDTLYNNADLMEVRRVLNIPHEALNRSLIEFGQPILSNEPELRRLFDLWKDDVRFEALDRIRRHFLGTFRQKKPLQDYVTLRSLDFIEFDKSWVLERDDLDRTTVATYVDLAIDKRLGPDVDVRIGGYKSIREHNRRTMQAFIDTALPIARAWCVKRQALPDGLAIGSMDVLKRIDSKGLLDFDRIATGGEAALLQQLDMWPAEMPTDLVLAQTQILPADIDASALEQQRQREQYAKAKRTVTIGGTDFDTADADFASRITKLAESMMEDKAWLVRSMRKFNLRQMPAKHGANSSSTGSAGGGRVERISDDKKNAMGFLSEFLASRYLAEKHPLRFSDSSWVSRNREALLTDGEGKDSWGYDFRVQTADADWRYEVKSSLDDSFEFEFTQNEMRVAGECAADRSRRYRILYVPFVFDPARWRVMELPNPFSEKGRQLFRPIGNGSTRMKFGITSSSG